MPSPNQIYASPLAKQYTSFGSDINLITEGTSLDAAATSGCREIRVASSGNLALILSASPTAVTFTNLSAGERLPVNAVTIVASGTTVTDIQVLW